ncbi:MAG: hypothetical protein PHP54_03455 [Clostridia bacterium]|nr:hypothetical protein [Clostridia bacterium]
MEDSLQRVFSIIIAVVIFFLLPLYIAFEKKDDISYSLALKITTNFANDVKNKGYLTLGMYNKFIENLAVSDNAYDITIEHVAKKYNPVIYSYKDDTYKEIVATFDYNLYKNQFEKDRVIKDSRGNIYDNLILAYELSEERYTGSQIIDMLEGARVNEIATNALDITDTNVYKRMNASEISLVSGLYKIDDVSSPTGKTVVYPMNKGDQFTVIIRNTNTTIASVLFNTLTFGADTGNNMKVYINYGGTIQNESYRYASIQM